MVYSALIFVGQNPQTAITRQELKTVSVERNGYEKLSDTIRQLFPSAFEYTEEIGYIPKGWKVGVLDAILILTAS